MKLSLPGQIAATLAAIPIALLAAAPVSAQSERCLNMDCFYDHQVRSFKAVDSDTMIIYIGRERCPFLVELRGFYCDANFLPDVNFFHERERRMGTAGGTSRTNERIRRRVFGDRSGANGALGNDRADGFPRNDRICMNNAGQYALETFGFSPYIEDSIPSGVAECPVINVTALTDDDLVELYTQDGVPPPPPIGNGTISRKAPDDDVTGTTEIPAE